MPPLPEWLRPLPYLLLGLLVGFLFLAEFGLMTVAAVQVTLLVLAIASLGGVVLRLRRLELWALFTGGAIVIPLIVDSHLVGLPRCDAVRPGVACLAGTEDVVGRFQMELLTLVVSVVAVVLLTARPVLELRGPARDN